MAGTSPADIDRIMDRITLNFIGKIRAAMSGLCSKIVMSTPVKTGQARGNWILTYNTMSKAKTGVLDKSGEATLAKLAEELEKFDPMRHKRIWFSNTLPYIVMLEFGWSSTQAPAGMVRKSVLEIQSLTRGQL